MQAALTPLFALGLCLTAQAPAPKPTGEQAKTEARKYFEAGKQAYASGDYLSAARAFSQANELLPSPAIVFSMAQSYRLHFYTDRRPEHLQSSVELYRRYLREAKTGNRRRDAVEHLATLEPQLRALQPEGGSPPPPKTSPTQLMITTRTPKATIALDGQKMGGSPVIKEVKAGEHKVRFEAEGYFSEEVDATAVAERLIVVELNLKPKPALVDIKAPDGATISIDGRPLGKAPLLQPVEIEAGAHVLSVSQSGSYIYTREVELSRGEKVKLDIELEATTQRTTSYYFLVSGGATLVATAVVVAIALISEGQARLIIRKRDQMMMNLTEVERDDYIRARDRRNDLLTASTAALVGGTLLSSVGVLLFTLDSPRAKDSEDSVALDTVPTPAFGPGYAGAQWGMRF